MFLNEAALKKPNIYAISTKFIDKKGLIYTILLSLYSPFLVPKFRKHVLFMYTKRIYLLNMYLYTSTIPIFLQKRSTKPTILPATNYGLSCTYFELCSSRLPCYEPAGSEILSDRPHHAFLSGVVSLYPMPFLLVGKIKNTKLDKNAVPRGRFFRSSLVLEPALGKKHLCSPTSLNATVRNTTAVKKACT